VTIGAIFLFLGEAYRFVIKHWRAVFIAFVVVGLFVGVAMLKGCWTEHQQQKVTNDLNNSNSQIFQANTNSGIIEGEQTKRETEAKDAEKKTKPAIEAVNRARANDSRKSDTDAGTAAKRFCESYPNDSRCIGNAQ
jgi:hypothetical protein